MTQIDSDIRAFILRALLRFGRALSMQILKDQIRNAFPVTFTDGDLSRRIKDCEDAGLIAGTDDAVRGQVWALTPDGKIAAQQLG